MTTRQREQIHFSTPIFKSRGIAVSNMASCCVCSSLSFVKLSKDLKDSFRIQRPLDLLLLLSSVNQLQSVRQGFIYSAEEGIGWVQVST